MKMITIFLLFILVACNPIEQQSEKNAAKYTKMIEVTPGEDVTFNTKEDQPYPFEFTAVYIDQMVNPEIHIQSEPEHGKLSDCSSDKNKLKCTYTPNKDYNGQDSFSVTSNDGDFTTSTPTKITFVIEAVPDAPVASTEAQSFSLYSNEHLNIEVANASDVDSNKEDLRYVVVRKPSKGELEKCFEELEVKSCVYVPRTDRGEDSFSYKVIDKEGLSSKEVTVTIIIKKYYPPPVVGANQTVAVDFQSSVKFEVSEGSDPDTLPADLKYVIVTAPSKGKLDCFLTLASRSCEYTPSINGGVDSFSYKIVDADGMESKSNATVTINIKKILFAPIAASAQTLKATYNSTLRFEVPSATYPYPPDAYQVKYQLITAPTQGTLSNCFGNGAYNVNSCEYTASINGGSDFFTYKIVDADKMESSIATVNITIAAIANRPVGSGQSFDVTYNVPMTFTVTAGNLTYPTSALKNFNYKIHSTTLGGSVSNCFTTAGNRQCTYTPSSNGGKGSVTYTITDTLTNLTSDPITVSMNISAVDFAPTASEMYLTATYGSSNTFDVNSGVLLVKRSDNPNPTFTYKLSTPPINGTLSNCLVAGGTSCTYTPTNSAEADSFKYIITDTLSKKESLPITVRFTISQLHPPVAYVGQEVIIEYNKNPSFEIMAASDKNSAPASLTYTITRLPEKGSLNCTARTCTYTPTVSEGTDFFQYVVSDGLLSSNPATLTLKIVPAPTIQENAPVSLVFGTSVGFVIGTYRYTGITNVPLNPGFDSRPEHVLLYKIIDNPAFGSLTCINTAGMACLYTTTSPILADSFTYVAFDTLGNQSAPARVEINVVHAPKVGNNQIINVLHGNTYPFTVNAGSDFDDTTPSSLSYVLDTNVSQGSLSCFTGATPLACSYKTNANTTAKTDSFSYHIVDPQGHSSSKANVTINIAYPPTVGANQAVTVEYKNNPAFMVNAGKDVETLATALTYKVTKSPTKGSLSNCFQGAGNRSCLYTPNANEMSGTDSFEYVVTDSDKNDAGTPATVSITILPPPSVGADQSLTFKYGGGAQSFTVSQASDSIAAHNSGLSYKLVTSPQEGTLSNCFSPSTSRSCQYTPSVNGGSDSFTYTVSDTLGNEAKSAATVNITIDPLFYAPVIGADLTVSIKLNTKESFMVNPASDQDTIAESLKYVVVTNPSRGTLQNCFVNGVYDKGIRSCEYTPNLNEVGGVDSFTYKVVDDRGLTSAVGKVNFTMGENLSKSESFTVKASGALDGVDILWVMDNSGSMEDEQAAVGKSMAVFIKNFADNANYDFNMQVICTGTFQASEGGRFKTVKSNPNYKFNSASLAQDKNLFINNFKEVIQIPTQSGQKESPYASIKAAYTANPSSFPWNDNDRALIFIIITDTREQSGGTAASWTTQFQAIKAGNLQLLDMFAIVRPGEDSNSTFKTTVANLGGLYLNLTDFMNSATTADTMMSNISNAVVTLLDSFTLNCPGSLIRESVKVTVNGADSTDWSLSADNKTLKLTKLPAVGSSVVVSYSYR
ncbi:MAG: tandem-95 repeat protein [Oligoflexia bacterium]|nr:tandem-95 repeat protein [Oligoflexia bacterium]